MRINDYACTYRNYGSFILVYCNANHNHFILQNVFQHFFQCVYIEHQNPAVVIENTAKKFNVDQQRVESDFQKFTEELLSNCAPVQLIKGQEEKANQEDRIDDKYIFDIMANSVIPFSATIELTDTCNLRCVHCYRGKPVHSYWNLSTIESLLQQLQAMGTMHITITGGEPFMHPDCIKILELIGNMGFVLSVQTNATIGAEYLAEYAKLYPIKSVSVSIYSTLAATHDKITKIPGSLSMTLKAVEFLVKKDVPVSINCPVMTINVHDMEKLKAYADEMGIICNFAFKIIPSQEDDKDTAKLNCFSADLLYACMKNCNIQLYQNILEDIRKSKPKDRYCQTGFRSITLDAQGNVIICNAYRKKCGNIKEKEISEIWMHSQSLTEWRNTLSKVNDKCKACKAYAYCEPCPAHSYTLCGDDTKIDDITCDFGMAFYKADSQNIN